MTSQTISTITVKYAISYSVSKLLFYKLMCICKLLTLKVKQPVILLTKWSHSGIAEELQFRTSKQQQKPYRQDWRTKGRNAFL